MSLTNYSYIKKNTELAWEAETSYQPEIWTKDNPAYGQCAITALHIQDILGGEIVRVVFRDQKITGSHYFNFLPTNNILDLTYNQFSSSVIFETDLNNIPKLLDETKHYITKKGYKNTREYLLSDKSTQQRYKKLKANINAL